MKKIYTCLFVLTFLIGSVFAQGVKKEVNFPSKAQNITFNMMNSNSDVNAKGVLANLDESFDVFPPASWTADPAADYWMHVLTSPFSSAASYYSDGSFAVFDAWDLDAGEVGSLITPVLHPAAGNNTLSYEVYELYGGNPSYIASGLTLYIEFSTDGGTSWTTSTTNVLTAVTGHNTATVVTTATVLTASLSAYNGGSVQVRFRSVSDYGGFVLGLDNVTGPEADVTLSATDLIVTPVLQNGMTPLNHAGFMLAGNVSNVGQDMAAGAASLTITAGAFSEVLPLPIIAYGDDTSMYATSPFTATATGNITLNYSAPLAADPNPGDNSASQTIAITDTIFATDDGTIVAGLGSNTAPIIFGNLYYLVEDDIATSISVGWGAVTADEAFTMSIYSVDVTTYACTLVYTTPNTIRGASVASSVATYGIPAQSLTAGLYLVTVNQIAAVNVQVAYTDETGGILYIYDATDGLGFNNSFGNIIIRLNLGTPVSAETTEMNSAVSVYPNPANDVIFVSEVANITVINMIGQVVASVNNANQINVSALPTGNYIVKVQNNNNSIVQKISIVR